MKQHAEAIARALYLELRIAQFERLGDGTECTCYPGDRCPPCRSHDAMTAAYQFLSEEDNGEA